MTTSQELLDQMRAMSERMDRQRAEDKDQRHTQNKHIQGVVERMDQRVTALEVNCREQEAVCEKTKQTTDRIFNLLQGDPELGSDGFIVRQTKAQMDINARLEQIEADKTESKNHRAQAAGLPERVATLEQLVRDGKIRVSTAIAVLSGLVTLGGIAGATVTWVLSLWN